MSNLPAVIGGRDVAPSAAFTEALDAALGYALAEKAESTKRAYESDFRHFSAWCESVNADALPAKVGTVAGYLASIADAGLKASTIARRTAAITHFHRLRGFEPPTASEKVKSVQRGIRRKIGVAVERKAPATAKAIAAMIKLIPDTLAGRRDRALLLLGFAAALRRSEIVALQARDLERATEGLLVHIRRSKTDQEGAGLLVSI